MKSQNFFDTTNEFQFVFKILSTFSGLLKIYKLLFEHIDIFCTENITRYKSKLMIRLLKLGCVKSFIIKGY